MLPGHIAGHYDRPDLMIDLVRLARFAGARLILDRVTGIDRRAKQVILQDRPPISYDVASIDIGISRICPICRAMRAMRFPQSRLAIMPKAEAFVAQGLPRPRLVVIGAGIGGVELALASAYRLRQAGLIRRSR